MPFKKNIEALRTALDNAIKHGIVLGTKIDNGKALIDYNVQQKKYFQERLLNSLKSVNESSFELKNNKKFNEISRKNAEEILSLLHGLESSNLTDINNTLFKIENLLKNVKFPDDNDKLVKIPKRIPSDIKEDLVLDLEELQKCYDNECYRSCVIICGRVLETALHRRYYEVTGQDVLEKNPGIGLGNLIAKMNEKSINLDPGLTNQIHLINQVRVFSVHKKKEAFYPSEQQTQAMILYTLDILNKLFS
jgi:hypothetical protein